jgi:hypothetical protein
MYYDFKYIVQVFWRNVKWYLMKCVV